MSPPTATATMTAKGDRIPNPNVPGSGEIIGISLAPMVVHSGALATPVVETAGASANEPDP